MTSLYGIVNSNRENAAHWTKNCFNSSFPTSLLCWMRNNNIDPKWIHIEENLSFSVGEISANEVFGTMAPNESLHFLFESTFPVYQQYAYDHITGIDLVIAHNNQHLRPLEMKLTVVPDNTTAERDEDDWAPELVIRPASTQFCALGMAHAASANMHELRAVFDPLCSRIQHWDSHIEIGANLNDFLDCLDVFQSNFCRYEVPFLVNTVWKTLGKNAALADPAFDIFIWSDHALCRLFIDRARTAGDGRVGRHARAAVRLARTLWEISRGNRTRLADIYTEMAFGLQTDKEFATSGIMNRQMLGDASFGVPRINQAVLTELIQGGGEKLLSPERRFDASIYFTAAHLFEEQN